MNGAAALDTVVCERERVVDSGYVVTYADGFLDRPLAGINGAIDEAWVFQSVAEAEQAIDNLGKVRRERYGGDPRVVEVERSVRLVGPRQTFTHVGVLPDLNTMLANRVRTAKCSTWNKYAAEKKRVEETLWAEIIAAQLRPVARARFLFVWREEHGRRDPDNIRAGAKFVLDALVTAEIIPDDSQKHVAGLADEFAVAGAGEQPGVTVIIEETE